MKILIRPGLFLASGLLAIGVGVSAMNWRLARDAARDRADYFEERVLGQTKRAKSFAERYTDLLARYAVLQDELTRVRQDYASEHAAHEPLRRQIESLIGGQIQHQAAVNDKDRQLKAARMQVKRLIEQKATFEQAIAAGSSTNASLTAANAELQAELATAKTEQTVLAAACDGALKQAKSSMAELAALRTELTTLQGKHATCEQNLLVAQQRIATLTAELQKLRQTIDKPPPAGP